MSRNASRAGQGSLINHNLWSQTLKLLQLGVKGEALQAPRAGDKSHLAHLRSPCPPREGWEHSWRAPAQQPPWFMVGGQGNNNPWKEVGAGMPGLTQPAAPRALPSRNTLPVLSLSILPLEYLCLRPQSWCLSAEDPKSCPAQHPRAQFPPLWWLGLLGARANTTNAVSLKPLQCRCCFHGN